LILFLLKIAQEWWLHYATMSIFEDILGKKRQWLRE
jgi:hypothetical protein